MNKREKLKCYHLVRGTVDVSKAVERQKARRGTLLALARSGVVTGTPEQLDNTQ